MSESTNLYRELLSPPGDTIMETLDVLGMSQAELAVRIGRPKEKINDIIKGRQPITKSTAFKLEKVLGIPASFWLNRENEYRRLLFEIEQQELFDEYKDWLGKFPLAEMCKLGLLPDTHEKSRLVDELLKFFGVASPVEWNRIYIDEKVSSVFRISLANTRSPHAISVWLRIGELELRETSIGEFDRKALFNKLNEIKELAYKLPGDFASQLQQICASCGLALIFTPGLPKAPISGAVRWINKTPLIQLTGRFKTDDHFWFNFFHEAAHVLLHGKKNIFLEEVEGAYLDQKMEKEANKFAEDFLLSQGELKQVVESQPLDETRIIAFADKFKTPPGVIIGRLQHLKIIPYSWGNKFRRKIELFDLS